jgi:ADP-ribose pyrophosphatase YjhB (NUDIX family)
MAEQHLYLEHDGKVLLVDANGNGPQLPIRGRTSVDSDATNDGWIYRLPSEEEASKLGLTWQVKRVNRFKFGDEIHEVTHALPDVEWPRDWAWKDNLISDSGVHPAARESVYRTMHRLVAKVVLRNPQGQLLLQKVKRGFFTGHWTLPGGFLDYAEHPRRGAERELLEELGVKLTLPDPRGETGEVHSGIDRCIVQERIFNAEGIDWISFTYLVDVEEGIEFVLKPDEVEEAKWFDKNDALSIGASLFDIEAFRIFIEEE